MITAWAVEPEDAPVALSAKGPSCASEWADPSDVYRAAETDRRVAGRSTDVHAIGDRRGFRPHPARRSRSDPAHEAHSGGGLHRPAVLDDGGDRPVDTGPG
jgi:hypothetical protein